MTPESPAREWGDATEEADDEEGEAEEDDSESWDVHAKAAEGCRAGVVGAFSRGEWMGVETPVGCDMSFRIRTSRSREAEAAAARALCSCVLSSDTEHKDNSLFAL